jgi:hypothetical protein
MTNTLISLEDNDSSDYDAEWGLDTDSPDNDAVAHTDDSSTPEEAATVTAESASEDQEKPASPSADPKTAESDDDTTWANATPEQLKAFKKAESDEKAMKGRHRLSNDKNAMLEKELQQLRAENADYLKKQRVPSQFEQDHPEYAEDLNKLYGAKDGANAPAEVDPAETIIEAHPDAGEIYNSNEFQIWIAAQSKPVRQAIESSDAESIVDILNQYKTVSPPQDSVPSSNNAQLQDLSGTGGSSGRVDLRSVGSMSTEEQYDAEWATD